MLLDFHNEKHLSAFHFVFQRHINASLGEFKQQWNHYGMQTTGHQTPLPLWQTNMVLIADGLPLDNFEECGIDYDGPLPTTVTDNNVVVPTSYC